MEEHIKELEINLNKLKTIQEDLLQTPSPTISCSLCNFSDPPLKKFFFDKINHNFFKNFNIGVLVIDVEGNIIDVSSKMCLLLKAFFDIDLSVKNNVDSFFTLFVDGEVVPIMKFLGNGYKDSLKKSKIKFKIDEDVDYLTLRVVEVENLVSYSNCYILTFINYNLEESNGN